MKIIKEGCYKGTRIILGNRKSDYLEDCRQFLIEDGYDQITFPTINFADTFKDKVGEENNNMMFEVKDRSDRELCLPPEYTALVQQLTNTEFRNKKDVKLFYIQECFRGEKPQRGRYRQFTQLGVEVINPTEKTTIESLAILANELIRLFNKAGSGEFETDFDVSRGLDYYDDGKGFEITCPQLGTSKQICGGGKYEGGIGFAIGIDRLLTL